MDITNAFALLLMSAPLAVAVALAVSIRRSRAKAREARQRADRLNARIMFRGHLLKALDQDATPLQVFRAGYRIALLEHAPHKLAEFDADWPHDVGPRP